ncbi:MAG: leucine-rich repeat domain-containing protein, partial [Tannerella sp.]|nr:leucine-rich repeat domain-containing protein [Tannerella sp.]
MKKLILLFAITLLPAAGFAQSGTIGSLTWSLSGGTLTISGTGNMPYYEYGGAPPWQNYRETITTVRIESGVSGIGGIAFAYCNNLISITVDEENESYFSMDGVLFYRSYGSITPPASNNNLIGLVLYPGGKTGHYDIPDNVTTIGSYAFAGCINLPSITIPDNVTWIGASAFAGCINLSSITIPDNVTDIGASAFTGCSRLASVTISDNVTAIGEYTFAECGNLSSITIPNNVTKIGASAFTGCTALPSITIPDNVTSIGDSAFTGCSSLASVTIPAGVYAIGDRAFSCCDNLIAITVDEENESYFSTGGVLFHRYNGGIIISRSAPILSASNYNAIALVQYPGGKAGHYDIPDNVTEIESYAFAGCINLPSITIPNSVTSINSYAFYECSSLASVTIPAGVSIIRDRAFSYCDNLNAITVDEENESYFSADGVLFYSYNNKLVQYPGGKAGHYDIPDNVTEIGSYAFSGCTALPSITIPADVNYIGYRAFT